MIYAIVKVTTVLLILQNLVKLINYNTLYWLVF